MNRKDEVISNKKAAIESLFWVVISLAFSGVVYYVFKEGLIENPSNIKPEEATAQYIQGYLLEKSLSVDNLFVMALIFAAFKIPLQYQHKALFWGIVGAIVLRGIAIGAGILLVREIGWITYVFGAFLVFTALKMLWSKDDDEEVNEKKYMKRLQRFFKISKELDGNKFWTVKNGVRMATPLFAALVIIEFSDLLFALDSIPAILVTTSDPFVAFSSNIFAILGLRAMYFFLANMLDRFQYLEYSVFVILIYVGVKIMIHDFLHIPEWISLSFIALSLTAGVIFSLMREKKTVSSEEE